MLVIIKKAAILIITSLLLSWDDNQKKTLIFLREAGAVNNLVFRQLSGEDTLYASVALRELRDVGLIEQKGRGNSTYYIPTEILFQDDTLMLQDNDSSMQDSKLVEEVLKRLKKRLKFVALSQIIVDLCKIKGFERVELSALINRDETYVRTILTKLVKTGRLRMKYPEMPKHPHQAYIATETE